MGAGSAQMPSGFSFRYSKRTCKLEPPGRLVLMLSDHSRAHELGPSLRFCGVVGSISAGLLCVGLLCAFRHGGFLLNMFSGNRDCCTRRARNPRRLAAVGTCGGRGRRASGLSRTCSNEGAHISTSDSSLDDGAVSDVSPQSGTNSSMVLIKTTKGHGLKQKCKEHCGSEQIWC